MREITEHKINTANDRVSIEVLDAPGQGGASHAYRVSGFDNSTNVSAGDGETQCGATAQVLYFQNGPINEVGVNGLTHEVLLAIVADRLRSFQAGAYACRENALALTKIEEAQHWLQSRTRARMARGVEGTHQK